MRVSVVIIAIVSLFAFSVAEKIEAQMFGKNKVKWHTGDFNYKIMSGPNTDVYYYSGGDKVASTALSAMEASYDTLSSLFGIETEERPKIVVYLTNHIKEHDIYPGIMPEGVAGYFEFMKERIVVPFSGDYNWFVCVVRHEMVHRFQAEARRTFGEEDWLNTATSERKPLWWTEGLAEYWAGRHGTCRGMLREVLLRDAIIHGATPSLDEMGRFAYGSFFPYLYGFELVRFLGEKYGDERIVEMYQEAKNFSHFRSLFESVYERTFEEVSEEFWHEMRSKYLAQYDSDTPPPNVHAEEFLPGALGVSVQTTYNRNDSTFAIVYSRANGYDNLYTAHIPTDKPKEEKETLKKEASPYWIDEGETPLLMRSGGEGFERINPRVDVHNGRLMVVSVTDKESEVLVVYDIEERKEVNRIRFENISIIRSPSWNNTGRKVVFSGSHFNADDPKSGVFNLYLADIETGDIQNLTEDIYLDKNPRWSPDDRWIVFESDRTRGGKDGRTNLFLLSPKNGDIRHLTEGEWRDESPEWSEKGDRVVFSSDRNESYDVYSCDLQGECERLTRYFGSSFIPHLVAGDSMLVFDAYVRGQRKPHLQKLPSKNMVGKDERSAQGGSQKSWDNNWRWQTVDSAGCNCVSVAEYEDDYDLIFAEGGVSATAGHGASLGGAVALSDKFEHKIFMAGVGYNTYSYVPKHNSFAATAQFINRRNRFNWGAALYGRSGPRIDAPRRNLFSAYEVGTSVFGIYPLSLYRRFEVWGGLSYIDQEHLGGWRMPDDFMHTEDNADLTAKGLLANIGGAYVHDNTLWYMSGPISGKRFRIQADITPNISALSPERKSGENIFSDRPFFPGHESTSSEERSKLFSYTAMVDYRHYFRIGTRSTYGVRAFGFYSGGEVPTRLSAGKMGGMGAFYPWYTPYGSRMWMVNQRVTIPVIDGMRFSTPFFGNTHLLSIQGSAFADFSQVWLEDNSNRGPVWGDYGVGLRIPLMVPGVMLRLDYGKIFTIGDSFEIPKEYQGMRFGWWIGFDF